MKDRVTVRVVFGLIAVALGLALSTAPVAADDLAAGLFVTSGQTNLGVSWSLNLTQAPSVPLMAEGLLAGKCYGIGVATPITTFTAPLFKALKLKPSSQFDAVLAAVQVGGAVLTPNSKTFDCGLYARVTAFKLGY